MTEEAVPQFVALKRRSQEVQSALETVYQQLKVAEEELADFLDDYYRRVGGAFETLTRLQCELQALRAGCFGAVAASPAADARTEASPSALKAFYRDLARECHPDRLASEHPDIQALKSEMMKTLNAAYARKNLSEMWQLKWQLEQQKHDGALSHKQRLELLRAQQKQMQSALDELRQKHSELKESPAWQLMQHARLMQACGQDFIALVKARVEYQLAQTRRELRAARHQARYWSHVRIDSSTPLSSN